MSQRAPFAQGTILGQEQLATLLESVQELLAILSSDGVIQFASAGFTPVLGHSSEDLVGRSIFELLHPDDVVGVRECLREVSAGHPGKFEKR